jgi:hypothetical protein
VKQIAYDFDLMTLVGALVACEEIEDGFWEVNLNTECVTMGFPGVVPAAEQTFLPGHLIRVKGVRLLRVFQLSNMSIEVKNGLITEVGFALNTYQRRPEEGGGGSGENSGPAPDGYPTPAAAGF